MDRLQLLASIRRELMLSESDVMHPIKHRLGHYYCPNCGAGEHSKTGAIPNTPSPRPDTPTPKLQKCYGCGVRLRTPGHLLRQEKALHDKERATAQQEGKEYKTPEFVRHCVTSITERPKDLARVESGQRGDGSPFAVCWSKYNADKKSLAAKHATGQHHTNKDYEQALGKLREATEQLRSNKPCRSSITFTGAPSKLDRSNLTYRQEERHGAEGDRSGA